MFRHVVALVLVVCCLSPACSPAWAQGDGATATPDRGRSGTVVRFPKTTTPAFLIDLLGNWSTQEDQFGGLQVFPNDHASAIYLSVTRDPQYAEHPLKDVATAIGNAAGITEFTKQEPATLSGIEGEAFYAVMKNQRGVELDVKMVLAPLERDLWAVEMTMTPKNLNATGRTQISQMVGRITLTKAP
jgi:hypothetical protein